MHARGGCGEGVQALEREPRYVKALLRRATGLERLPPPDTPALDFIGSDEYGGSCLAL